MEVVRAVVASIKVLLLLLLLAAAAIKQHVNCIPLSHRYLWVHSVKSNVLVCNRFCSECGQPQKLSTTVINTLYTIPSSWKEGSKTNAKRNHYQCHNHLLLDFLYFQYCCNMKHIKYNRNEQNWLGRVCQKGKIKMQK